MLWYYIPKKGIINKMVKRKNYFTKKFNVWDVTLIVLLIASSFFILKTLSIADLFEKIAWIVFGISFSALFIKLVKKLIKRFKK